MNSKKASMLAFFVLTLIFTITYAQASSCSGFGSIPHTRQVVTVEPSSSNYVDVSLFNCKSDDLLVEISVDNLPKGWWVDIESPYKRGSDTVYLESQTPTKTPDSGGSWFILLDGATYIKTVPVRLKIGVPDNAWGGLYTLKVTAFASPATVKEGEGFNIIPKFGREFNFYIQIPAPYKPQGEDSSDSGDKADENKIIEDLKDKVDSKKSDETDTQKGDMQDDEPSIIQGHEEKEQITRSDGITGFTIGGLSGTSIIILIIILLVIGALLFYLRS